MNRWYWAAVVYVPPLRLHLARARMANEQGGAVWPWQIGHGWNNVTTAIPATTIWAIGSGRTESAPRHCSASPTAASLAVAGFFAPKTSGAAPTRPRRRTGAAGLDVNALPARRTSFSIFIESTHSVAKINHDDTCLSSGAATGPAGSTSCPCSPTQRDPDGAGARTAGHRRISGQPPTSSRCATVAVLGACRRSRCST